MVKVNWTALPSVFLAAALIAGEVLGFASPGFAGLWPWAFLIALLITCVYVGWTIPYGMYLLVFMAGVALAWRSESNRMAVEEFARSSTSGGRCPLFTLKVDGNVVCRTGKDGKPRVSFDSWMKNIPIRVIAPLPHGADMPKVDEWWRCSGWLTLRKKSFSRYSRRTLWVLKDDVFEKALEVESGVVKSLYRGISCALSRRVSHGLCWSDELASFGNAMLLGRRDGVVYGKLAVFAVAGTVHVFAISGLHVMLIAGMILGFLRMSGFSARMCSVFAIPALWSYVMLIGCAPSAIRAATMTSLYLAARLLGRQSDSLSAWGASVMLIYAISPEMVFNVGCVLSFAVMLGILLWLRWTAQFASPADYILKIAAVESMLGCEWRKSTVLWLYRRVSWILGMMGISFAAWIAGAPIAARVFGRLSSGSVIVNVAVVPLAGMAVGFAVFGVLTSFVLPYLGMFFNNLAALSIYAMWRISEVVAEIPGSYVETLPWSWCDCAMWYIAWFAFFALLSRHLPQRERIHVKEWEKEDVKGCC